MMAATSLFGSCVNMFAGEAVEAYGHAGAEERQDGDPEVPHLPAGL